MGIVYYNTTLCSLAILRLFNFENHWFIIIHYGDEDVLNISVILGQYYIFYENV